MYRHKDNWKIKRQEETKNSILHIQQIISPKWCLGGFYDLDSLNNNQLVQKFFLGS